MADSVRRWWTLAYPGVWKRANPRHETRIPSVFLEGSLRSAMRTGGVSPSPFFLGCVLLLYNSLCYVWDCRARPAIVRHSCSFSRTGAGFVLRGILRLGTKRRDASLGMGGLDIANCVLGIDLQVLLLVLGG